ncbi:hypothetical protein GGF32_005037 [Allomyces javanicus]|nr:hypothetical protein GGF32_005037 [Allomyces javanicus]
MDPARHHAWHAYAGASTALPAPSATTAAAGPVHGSTYDQANGYPPPANHGQYFAPNPFAAMQQHLAAAAAAAGVQGYRPPLAVQQMAVPTVQQTPAALAFHQLQAFTSPSSAPAPTIPMPLSSTSTAPGPTGAAQEEDEITILFALRAPIRASTNSTTAAPVMHVCEPVVLAPHDNVGKSLVQTMMATPLPPPALVLVRNLLQVGAHLADVVRGSGGAPVAVASDAQWHRPAPILTPISVSISVRLPQPFLLARSEPRLRPPSAREHPVPLAQPQSDPHSLVNDVMRESGLLINGVWFDFAPANPAELPTTRPPARDVLAILNVPRSIEDFTAVLRELNLKSAQLDYPPNWTAVGVPYAFLTVPRRYGGYVETLQGMWLAGRKLRLFRLDEAHALFADPPRVVAAVKALAMQVAAEEGAAEGGGAQR